MKQQTNEEIIETILNGIFLHGRDTPNLSHDLPDGQYTIAEGINIINKLLFSHRLSTLQEVEGKMKSLWADELNGDYTEEEKKNPLVAYNAALKRVLQVLASMKG